MGQNTLDCEYLISGHPKPIPKPSNFVKIKIFPNSQSVIYTPNP